MSLSHFPRVQVNASHAQTEPVGAMKWGHCHSWATCRDISSLRLSGRWSSFSIGELRTGGEGNTCGHKSSKESSEDLHSLLTVEDGAIIILELLTCLCLLQILPKLFLCLLLAEMSVSAATTCKKAHIFFKNIICIHSTQMSTGVKLQKSRGVKGR